MNTKKIIIGVGVVVVVLIILAFAFGRKSDAPQEEVQAPQETPGVFTMAQVAANAFSESCYTVVRGSVYDLTGWIAEHPGGPDAILNLCGTDGTSAFEGQHGGMELQEAKLASMKIGTLAR